MTQPAAPAVGDQAAASWAAQFEAWVGGTSTAFTPTLTATTTNPTLGASSSAVGTYIQVGNLVSGQGQIIFGTSGTNAGNGVYLVSLPTPVLATLPVGSLLGTARIVCAGLTTRCDLWLASVAGTCRLTYTSAAVNGSYVSTGATAPGAWTAGDSITYQFRYPSA